MKISGYSRQQVTRLIGQYRKTGRLQRRQRTVTGFRRKYLAQDIRLLAAMDERHETPCGPTVKKLYERACQIKDGIFVSCFFPENQVDAKGKQRKKYTYENMMTPYDKLRSLAHAEDYLKSGMNFEILDRIAHEISDNQAADQLLKARQILFKTINEQNQKTG